MNLSELQTLIDANQDVDFRKLALGHNTTHETAQTPLRFEGIDKSRALDLLQAYQRILRILPPSEDHRALPLLSMGLHSAIQIASAPEREFARRWATLFPGEEELAFTVHRAACSRRSALLHQHLNDIQRNEPHYRSARFK